eukprot:11667353-Karenia_brevis.AAC.1
MSAWALQLLETVWPLQDAERLLLGNKARHPLAGMDDEDDGVVDNDADEDGHDDDDDDDDND